MVINLGDIAHSYSPEAYRLYRETSNEVFAVLAKSPHEIFAFANHDWIGRKSEPFYDVYKDVKKHLGAAHDPCDIKVTKRA